MIRNVSIRPSRLLLALSLGLGVAFAAPMACFPDYTFDLSGATSSSSGNGTSSGAMASSSGMAGSPSSSSSTGSSTSSGSTGSSTSTSSSGATSSSSSSASSSSGGGCKCGDPGCMGVRACVPSVSGATYVAFYYGPNGGFTGTCGGGFPTPVLKGYGTMPTFQPAACNCSCGNPMMQQCEFMPPPANCNTPGSCDEVVVWGLPCASIGKSGGCFAPILSTQTPPNGTCAAGGTYAPGGNTCSNMSCTTGTGPCSESVVASQLQVTGGSCTAVAGPVTQPPPTWSVEGLACGGAMDTGGCSATEACLPVPSSGFNAGVCIMMPPSDGGAPQCPSPFTQPLTLYGNDDSNLQSYVDTRACGGCSCTTPDGGTCSATVTAYNSTSDTCNGTAEAIMTVTTQAGNCMAVATTSPSPQIGDVKVAFSAVNGGACTSVGMPMGTVVPINPATICCIPAADGGP